MQHSEVKMQTLPSASSKDFLKLSRAPSAWQSSRRPHVSSTLCLLTGAGSGACIAMAPRAGEITTYERSCECVRHPSFVVCH